MTPTLCLVESNRPPGNTVDLIRAATELGYETVLLTSDPASVAGLDLGGLATPPLVPADTQDGASIARAVSRLPGSGVAGLTTAHDFFAPVAAEAAAALGLPGPDPRAVWDCRRKDRLRVRLAGAAVPQPDFRVADTAGDAVRGADEIGYPVIVKPVALADSIGVVRCDGPGDVSAHVAALTDPSRYATRRPVPGNLRSRVLIEAYVAGREFTVEVLDGIALDATETSFGPPPGFVEFQHVLPAAGRPEPARPALLAAAERACAAVGLRQGFAHVELRLTGSAPVVIEINPRLAGGRIPELYRRASGRDLWRAAVRAATSAAPVAPPAATGTDSGVLRHLRLAGTAEPAGKDVATLGWRPRRSCHVHVVPHASPGAGPPTRTSDSIGWAVATAPGVADCVAILDDLWAELDAQVPLWPAAADRPGAAVGS
jgi:S-sulfo-L-cysteine synthase (3-phospho-L-serine-dependent)